ncbi:peptidase inhibitor 16-like [Anneissia japonica]|uniref:peptidase inhibitor 16-like n=1 Tax=Anneissia japonica TaxID=1529436 RepID=UPI001425B447|nr:peptidase inhibitor 16-like [Anneissia japonica]
MRDTIILHVLVYLFVQVEAIDPDAHVSFALVFPKETNRRLRRYVELSPSAYTEEEKKAMLDAHNEYRRITNPSAADMNLLTWNDQLADSVQTWTEECVWDHGQVEFENQQYDPMGQNLWRGGNKVSVSAVRAWMNEDKYYNYTEHVCQPGKVCGHYTQVLWDTTKQMGCGYHSCEDGKTIVGCNYGPAGNYNRRPYIEGPRCSQCSEPGFCYNGLCCKNLIFHIR